MAGPGAGDSRAKAGAGANDAEARAEAAEDGGAPAGRVLVVGDIATDVVAVLPAPLAGGLALGTDTAVRIGLTPGGSAANTATWLAGTGTPVTLIAAVGADSAGDARLAELSAAGVRPAVARVAAATGAIVVLSDPQERTMLCDRGANQLLPVEHVVAAVRAATSAGSPRDAGGSGSAGDAGATGGAGGAAWLHLSAYPLFDPGSAPAALAALATARAAGLRVSVDAASAGPLAAAGTAAHDWLRGIDLLFANLDEARVLVGDPAADPVDAGHRLTRLARTVVVKLGSAGAIRVDGDRVVRVDAVPVEVVDPTGAGDAFAAGLLAAELAGADPAAALRAGAALGARAVSQLGARP
ncbi:ribokinase [Actinocatenispora sera]|uniref:Ribokinase n=1 Tax=Actinocatenispora sera TaxID=390989 RepID=A0A810L6Y7_9ACTN|nr:ribokinase [Actinocatenispora sera]